MDKYDYLILDIIQDHRSLVHRSIRLGDIEDLFWKRIEHDHYMHIGGAHVGERVTNLFLQGMIQFKSGYSLTKKGREEINCQVY